MKNLLHTLRAPGMATVELALWLGAFALVLGFLVVTVFQALAAPVL